MTTGQKVTIQFNDKIVRQFMLASIIWGVVGMLVGVLIATQLNFWQANFGQAWLSFGRLRPLHTNAVIFAFVGNMMFAASITPLSAWSKHGWRVIFSPICTSGAGS